MNPKPKRDVMQFLIDQHIAERSPAEMAIGLLRFEALRRLSPRQYTELHKRNLAGESFDDMVDALINE